MILLETAVVEEAVVIPRTYYYGHNKILSTQLDRFGEFNSDQEAIEAIQKVEGAYKLFRWRGWGEGYPRHEIGKMDEIWRKPN